MPSESSTFTRSCGVEPGRVEALVVTALAEVVEALAGVAEADEAAVGRHAVLDQHSS